MDWNVCIPNAKAFVFLKCNSSNNFAEIPSEIHFDIGKHIYVLTSGFPSTQFFEIKY